ncbi:amidohydrolase family protein [Flavobacterium sp. CAU 1735]|uniref:metal-dependent hydrolase family protein n=1 Tax=Flavobacterium sp. CAU 1735 TaxID=3140361 RepID=UPI003261BB7B
MKFKYILTLFLMGGCFAMAQTKQVLIENVRLLDLKAAKLTTPMHVLVSGSTIQKISATAITADKEVIRINGGGKTLMPGLIDVHVHMTFGTFTMAQLMGEDLTEEFLVRKIGESAQQMLLRGFTSVRDAGGPIFPLKTAIDAGKLVGPRIWPSGAVVSQTAGHGDFRAPNERSRRFFGKPSRAEQVGATFIADGRDDVLTAVRENLRFGASQIKLMAGGGTSSAYDPIDVTQYTLDEMKAAVEAAADWGTYVMVHAYTPKAVQRAVEAGVKCIEHGQMLDEATLKLLAEKNVWLSLQNLMDNNDSMDEQRKQKRKPVLEGQNKVWPLAKMLGVKLAWGTDFLFQPELNDEQNSYILRLQKWFSNAEILKMITQDNGELLQLSGLRNPYPGKLGIVEEQALADLLLVDGDPLKDLSIIANPEKNFLLIMKNGQLYKNTIKAKK